MKIQFKKLNPQAQKPKFGKPGDAGADLVATSIDTHRDGQIVYGTGLAVEIPEGMVGLIFPRSSVRNYDLAMSNSVGVIDSGYRGEIMVTFNLNVQNVTYQSIHDLIDSQELDNENRWRNSFEQDLKYYEVGDRIAQLVIMPVPLIQYKEVEELSETQRGTDGHGSTGH
jgi:dUTP pyrophosphatase